MNENVPETGHGRQFFGERWGQDLVRGQHFEELLVVGWQVQPHIRNNVIANVENALNGELQVTLGIPVDQWIFDELLFTGLAVDLPKKCDVLPDLP